MLNFFAVVNAITCALIGKVDKKLRRYDKQRPSSKLMRAQLSSDDDAMQRRSPTRGPRKRRRPNKTKAIHNYYCSAVPFCSNFENSEVQIGGECADDDRDSVRSVGGGRQRATHGESLAA